MTRLTAQQRRKLRSKLRELKCPGCREKALDWDGATGTVTCGSCAARCGLADLGLEWHAGRTSYWTTERDRWPTAAVPDPRAWLDQDDVID